MCGEFAAKRGYNCTDGPYPLSCCPSGFSCQRNTAAFWSCQPSVTILSLNTCSGLKIKGAGDACGGVELCGKDQACGACCKDGLYCHRMSNMHWQCSKVAAFRGGLLG
jgi:hypothetical protein